MTSESPVKIKNTISFITHQILIIDLCRGCEQSVENLRANRV